MGKEKVEIRLIWEEDKMRHVIIGLGSIGKRHYNNLMRLIPQSDEIITVDPDPNSGAAFQVIPFSVKDCAVYICTPTILHFIQMTHAAMDEAAGIFIEKPMVDKYTEVRMRDDIPIAVGYCYRYHPVFQDIKRFGEHLRYLCLHASDKLDDRYGFTALETMASHSIDAALWCIGPAVSWSVKDTGHRAAIQIVHKNDCVTQIYADITSDPREAEVRFSTNIHSGRFGIERYDPMYGEEMKAWLNYLKTGEVGNLCTYEQAMQVQEIMRG